MSLIALFTLSLSGILDERWRESNHWFYVSFLLLWILLGASLLWVYQRLYHPRKVSWLLSLILVLFMAVPAMTITEHVLRFTLVTEIEVEGEVLAIHYTEAIRGFSNDANHEIRVDLQVGDRMIENVLIDRDDALSSGEEQLFRPGQKTICTFHQGPLGEVLREIRWSTKKEVSE